MNPSSAGCKAHGNCTSPSDADARETCWTVILCNTPGRKDDIGVQKGKARRPAASKQNHRTVEGLPNHPMSINWSGTGRERFLKKVNSPIETYAHQRLEGNHGSGITGKGLLESPDRKVVQFLGKTAKNTRRMEKAYRVPVYEQIIKKKQLEAPRRRNYTKR